MTTSKQTTTGQNAVRAVRAALALNGYMTATGDNDPEAAVTDLLTDLRHWHDLGLVDRDFNNAVRVSGDHYAEEIYKENDNDQD